MSTGDAWHEPVNGCAIQPPFCDYELGNCGSKSSYVFFSCFQLIVGILLLNVFVAVLLEKYSVTDTLLRRYEHLEDFAKVWSMHDPNAEGCVSPETFITIIGSTPRPLGFGNRPHKRTDMLNFLRNPANNVAQENGKKKDVEEYWIPIHCVVENRILGEIHYYVKFDDALLQIAKTVGDMDVDAINWKFKKKESNYCHCAHFMHQWFAVRMLERLGKGIFQRLREKKKDENDPTSGVPTSGVPQVTHNTYNNTYNTYQVSPKNQRQKCQSRKLQFSITTKKTTIRKLDPNTINEG